MALRFLENLIAAGVSRGTPLLFATTGELLAERSGVLNLGVEGMMLLGAATGFAAAVESGSVLLGLLAAILCGALAGLLHALSTVRLPGDQTVAGLALGFFTAGLSSMIGARYVGLPGPRLPAFELALATLPLLGPALFSQNTIVYLGFLLPPLCSLYLHRTRAGLLLRAVGENPTAADAQGIGVGRVRALHVALGGALAGLAGASLSLAITPGWVEGMTGGQGWIAVGLVIFAGWNPGRAALGAYLFGAIGRLPLDLQGVDSLPFFKNPNLGYFLDMLPYLFTILVLVLTRLGRRRASRLGAPAALGQPFHRGER
jgi:simple sugar transport system permease protein